MTAAKTFAAVLDDRGVVSVAGPDAGKLLGGLVTNDVALLESAPALYAALLAPQGKVLFDFLIATGKDGFLLDTARARAAELVKRLSMYKLRADVEIRDLSESYRVAALWGGTPVSSGETAGSVAFQDPRLSGLGLRILADAKFAGDILSATNGMDAAADGYHAHRIALGVPEGGKDFRFGDTFPHEALFDQLNGLSFTKGCFIGQEVVSRMQHKTVVRKRVVQVVGDRTLPTGGGAVLAGEAEIGQLGSMAGARGLALLRLDRVAEARRAGVPILAGEVPVRVDVPPFATFRIEAPHEIA